MAREASRYRKLAASRSSQATHRHYVEDKRAGARWTARMSAKAMTTYGMILPRSISGRQGRGGHQPLEAPPLPLAHDAGRGQQRREQRQQDRDQPRHDEAHALEVGVVQDRGADVQADRRVRPPARRRYSARGFAEKASSAASMYPTATLARVVSAPSSSTCTCAGRPAPSLRLRSGGITRTKHDSGVLATRR